MALIKCPECGKKISDKAPCCPNCGCPIQETNIQPEEKPNDTTQNGKTAGNKQSTRKTLVISIIVVLLLAALLGIYYYLSTSDKRNYEKANALYKEQNYEEALVLYESLGDYEDSVQLSEKCNIEFEMTRNADYDFLNTIEESALDRMETTAKENYSKQQVVDTELAYLEKFENETFYDEELQKLAQKYIEGLRMQKQSLSAEFESDKQIEWQRGLVTREEVLCSLYEEYQLLTDNSDFIAHYIKSYDEDKRILDAYDAIEATLLSQISAENFAPDVKYYGEDAELFFTFKNNTEYTFSTVYKFSFVNANNILFQSTDVAVENIKPGQSYIVSVYVDHSNCDTDYCEYSYNNYYTDIQ